MPENLGSFDPAWLWLALGLILGGIEILAPGFFLIWMGLSAIIISLLAAFLPISIPMQVAFFAILSVVLVQLGKSWFQKNPIVSDDPLLNDRGGRMAGQIATVVEEISNGEGRVKLGDTEWNVRGMDSITGAKVRVTGTDGAVLLVEPV